MAICKNRIINVSCAEVDRVIKELKDENFYIVELDGDKIRDERDFVLEMKEKFRISVDFPKPVVGWLNDYICDLSWIQEEKIAIIIRNFDMFIKEDGKKRYDIMLDFAEIILPWWETDVENCMVGGKPRIFKVYLEV